MNEKLLKKICNKLNECGITDEFGDQFTTISSAIQQLAYLPKSNLKQIADFDVSHCRDFAAARNKWEGKGFLKFTPYVMDMETPVLCLSTDRFMQLVDDRYFRISSSPIGGDVIHQNTFSIGNVIELLHMKDAYRNSVLAYILLYCAMVDCGFWEDAFRVAYFEDDAAIIEFFDKTFKSIDIVLPFNYHILEQFGRDYAGVLRQSNSVDTVYEIRNGVKPVCRFRLGTNSVAIEYGSWLSKCGSRILEVRLPSSLVGIDTTVLNWSDRDIVDFTLSFYKKVTENYPPEIQVLVGMLKLVGVTLDFNKLGVLSTCNYIQDMPDENYTLCTSESLHQIYQQAKD